MDHKCTHRVQSSDRMHQHHLDQNKRLQQNWVNTRILQERQETDKVMRFQEHLMRSEYKDYVSRKMGAFESHYAPLPSNCKGCDHCDGGGRGNHHGRHRDDNEIHVVRAPYSVYQQGTGLYRSKSDETLSVSSSHPSKRHWKMKARSVRELKDKYLKKGVATEGYQASDVREKYLRNEMAVNNVDQLDVRPIPQGQNMATLPQSHSLYHYESQGGKQAMLSSGRSPEGQSTHNEYPDESPYLDPVSHYPSAAWNRKPLSSDALQQFTANSDKDTHTMQQDFEKLTVRNYPQSSLNDNSGQYQSTSTPVTASQIPRPRSGPNLMSMTATNQQPATTASNNNNMNSAESTPDRAPYNAPYNTPEYNGGTNNYNNTNSSYITGQNDSSRLTTTSGSSFVLSPDQVQIHHIKTDSGSNPDSGYGSNKIYGMRPMVSGRSINTNPDTFNNNTVRQLPPHHTQMSQYPTAATMRGVPPQSQQYRQQPQYPAPTASYQQRNYHTLNPATRAVTKNRGYSSDGCPGMRRPKPDAYASDNCAGMRMKKQPAYNHKGLNDWYQKQVSGKGNGVISEVPVNHSSQQQQTSQQVKPKDHWPGKATQV